MSTSLSVKRNVWGSPKLEESSSVDPDWPWTKCHCNPSIHYFSMDQSAHMTTLLSWLEIQRKEVRERYWFLTFVVHKEFVLRPIFRLLKKELPTFNIHFQVHLCGNSQRFLLDLQVKEETVQIYPKPPDILWNVILLTLITNFKEHLKCDEWYERFPVTSFISNRLKRRHFSLKKK